MTPMENRPAQGLHTDPWQQVRASFHALNVRLIRLALALGVSLENPRDLERVMRRSASASTQTERRSTADRRGASRSGQGPDRRVAHQWEELRGLVVLRYGVQKRCLEDFGIDVTRRVLAEVDTAMQREGFAPGAAGIDIDHDPGPGAA